MDNNNQKRVLTIDLEDWFHCFLKSQNSTDGYERRAHIPTHKILKILDEFGYKVTFFVLGDVAVNHLDLIKEIDACGHEIGSHGYAHDFITTLSPEAYRKDLRKSIEILENVTGKPVRSYRAPYFSVLDQTTWALEVLRDEGIRYDSSIFPIQLYRYGMPKAPRMPHKIIDDLWEWPITTLPSIFGNLPFAGGFYFRFFPWSFIHSAIKKIEKRNEPVLIYLHPWELDPDQPRFPGGSRFLNFRHYYRLKYTEGKLRRLLSLGRFTTLSSAMENIIKNSA